MKADPFSDDAVAGARRTGMLLSSGTLAGCVLGLLAFAALFALGRQHLPPDPQAPRDAIPLRWRSIGQGTGTYIQQSRPFHITGPWWRLSYRVAIRPGVDETFLRIRFIHAGFQEFPLAVNITRSPSGFFTLYGPGEYTMVVYSHQKWSITVEDEAR